MKLAVLSYSHHGRSMARTAHGLGHEIAGVMDAEPAPRQQLMDDFQCPGFETTAECLDTSKPDAVLVAGKHIEMGDHVQACVDRRIPYLLDKPLLPSHIQQCTKTVERVLAPMLTYCHTTSKGSQDLRDFDCGFPFC